MTAASRYQEQLMGLVASNKEAVSNHIRIDHMNAYGLRKGSATMAVSGTTSPPPISSIARRGEWSMGKVLDVYWHFSEPGDHYLGRILAGLDPTNASFGNLPPHWILNNSMENDDISHAMTLLFGPILAKHGGSASDPTAMLLRCAACIVYHSESLLSQMVSHPGHSFTKIAILHDRDLLQRLCDLVTIDPTHGVMDKATGIPPHVGLASKIKEILSQTIILAQVQKEQETTLVAALESAIDNKAWDSGNITGSRLREILDSYQSQSSKLVDVRLQSVDTQLKLIQESFFELTSGRGNEQPRRIIPIIRDNTNTKICSNVYQYNGQFYDVPETFEFPKVILRDAMRFWYIGQTVSKDCSQVVKPFRNIRFVPVRLKNIYKLQWKCIFSYLEKGIKLSESDAKNPTVNKMNEIYDDFVLYLKSTCEYCFTKKKGNPMSWSISTWSMRTRRSSILKDGTESDKEYASTSDVTGRNRPRGCISRKRVLIDNPLYPKRRKGIVAEITITPQLPPHPPSTAEELPPQPIQHQLLLPYKTNLPTKKGSTKSNTPSRRTKPPTEKGSTKSKTPARRTKLPTKKGPTKTNTPSRRISYRRQPSSAQKDQVEAAFAASFPSPKSPHHKCTYTDCQINSHIFFNKLSEKCGRPLCSLELHHPCMINYGSDTYGEASEEVGMRKLCKLCFTAAAIDKGLKHI